MISNGNEFYGDLENFFYHFMDLTDDSFIVIQSDEDFSIEFISNDRFVENLGYTPKSIIGSSFLHIIYSEDVEKMVYLLGEIGNNRLQSEEIRIKSFSSEIYWVDISLKKFNNKIFVNLKKISKIRDIKSGETYRLLYKNANDLIRVFNEKFEYEYLNENVHKRILGYSKDELIGKTQLHLYHPEDRKQALLSLSKILRTGNGSYQARFQHKNGDYKWLELSAKNFIDNTGNRKILSIARDITDKKLAEQKLKESEERYRELADLLPDIIFETDKNLNLTYVNSVAFNKFGYSTEDIKVGLNISSFIHPDYKEKASQQIKRLFEGRETTPNDYLLCKKDGTCFYARIHSRPILKNGIIVGIRGTITDINEIILAKQELMESEEKFRTIADQSFIGIIIIQDGIFKYLNDVTLTANGFTKEEIKKWGPYEFSKVVHPDDKEFVIEQVKKKEKGDKNVVQHYTYRIITKSGEIHWIENYSKTINYQGRPADLIMSLDVTGKIDAERKLKESEEKYRLITENSQDIVYTLDMNLNNTYISPSVYNVLGYDATDALFMTPKDTTHKDDLKIISQVNKELFKNERNKGKIGESNGNRIFTIREKHKDGRMLTMEHTISWLRDSDGRAVGILGVARDITEKLKTELLLKESEEKYRLLFENMNVGFAYHEVIVDEENKPIDYKYLEVNPKFEELTGLKKENLIGKTVTEAIPGTENDPADWIGKFGNVGLTGIPLTIEDYSEAINKWFNVSGYSPKKNHFAVTFTDITEIKKAESEVKASEKRYRQLFENSPVALMEMDLSGIREYVDRLRVSGIEDFNKFYEEYPHEIMNTLTKSKIINVNWKTLDIYKAQSKEDFFIRMNDLKYGKIHFTEDVILNNKMELLAFINGDTTYKSEMISKTFTGDPLYLYGKTSILPGYEKTWARAIVSIIDITDEKLTQQKLKDSEEKYRKLFENSPIGLMEQDYSEMKEYIHQLREQGIHDFGKYFEEFPSEVQKFMTKVKVVDGNRKIMEVYKFSTKEKFLSDMNQLAYNKMSDEIFLDNKREILALINGDAVYESEIKSKNSLGETIYLYGKTSIVPGFEGSWSEVIVSIVDITERKNAEKALEKSREMFRDLLETSSIGVIEFDIINNTIQYVNPKLLEIIGYKKEELIDLESHNKIIHPKDLPKLIESNDEMELEFRISDKNGKLKWVSGKKIPHFDENNNLISTRVWLEDVTDKKMYEELIYELNVNFLNFTADIQDNIHLLLNTALKLLNGDLIVYANRVKSDPQDEYYLITSDGDAYTYDINQFSKKLLLNEFFKEDHDFPQIFTDIDEGKYVDSDPLIKKIQAKGSFGKIIRTQDGLENIVCVFYKNNPVINGQDKLVLFLICDAIEIEQRRWQVQQDLEEQNKTLNKINKLKTELFSRTSHELKTPLISIKGFTELLLTLHKSKLDTETLSILEEIKDGSKRLEKIINLLLESTKLEAGQLELKKTKEDLTFLINFCVKELKGLATLRDQTILFNPSNKIEVLFDKERIYEVISNLLLNAVKYTPPGGEISIKSSVANDSIIISVTDNGIGFTEEEKKQVFKQFGKIERYGQGWDVAIEGTGLGLYITKKLVELHGGKIWLESEGRNKGSTFYFSIPKS